jgi:hypothetical protein
LYGMNCTLCIVPSGVNWATTSFELASEDVVVAGEGYQGVSLPLPVNRKSHRSGLHDGRLPAGAE